MTTAQQVGQRIAQARRELGVRLHRDVLRSELAQAVGVNPSTITAWEKGLKTPREDALAALARYLGVTPAYLRYGIEPDGHAVTPDPALDRRVTDAEIAAAERLVEAHSPPKRRRKRGAGGK